MLFGSQRSVSSIEGLAILRVIWGSASRRCTPGRIRLDIADRGQSGSTEGQSPELRRAERRTRSSSKRSRSCAATDYLSRAHPPGIMMDLARTTAGEARSEEAGLWRHETGSPSRDDRLRPHQRKGHICHKFQVDGPNEPRIGDTTEHWTS